MTDEDSRRPTTDDDRPPTTGRNTMSIDPAAVRTLTERARREVDEGLLPSCQLALGYQGEVVIFETFGDATPTTRYAMFSATKPFVASLVWQLLGEGKLALDQRVVDVFPEFAGDGPDREAKAAITVEQVLLHTSGFPHAPLGPKQWHDRTTRREAMAAWRLNWPPGTRYEYHPTSAHWVLAELIDLVTGSDYRDELERRVTGPMGLGRVLGLTPDQQGDIAVLEPVGEEATRDEVQAAFGVPELLMGEVTLELELRFNEPITREVGVPGGGGYLRADQLALFYQGLLHDPAGLWPPELLADATGHVRNSLPDPLMRTPANRSLGLILAGDDNRSHIRGLGRTLSPGAFGHPGAGGQLAWADPATGLSFAYLTNGLDQHAVREPRRGTALSSLAGVCATPQAA
jgi:CubicO group peptidase (beta-lactamase class C family)